MPAAQHIAVRCDIKSGTKQISIQQISKKVLQIQQAPYQASVIYRAFGGPWKFGMSFQ